MKQIFRMAVAAALLAAPFTAALAEPPPWAPAHGYRAKHQYVYYPAREIYWAPQSGLWFWIDGGNWRFGAELPLYYRQYTSGGVRIELDTDRPYTQHVHVVEHYGKGKSGKRGGPPGHDKGKGHPGKGKGRD